MGIGQVWLFLKNVRFVLLTTKKFKKETTVLKNGKTIVLEWIKTIIPENDRYKKGKTIVLKWKQSLWNENDSFKSYRFGIKMTIIAYLSENINLNLPTSLRT